MDWRKFVKALLFPHIGIMIIMLLVATVFLVYSMVCIEAESVIAIASYIFSVYTLTVWCMRIPDLIRFIKDIKHKNKYAIMWYGDTSLRINVSLYSTLIWNTAYAVFQLGLGLWHHSFWFFSMAGYYISLAAMRFFLVRHTIKHKPGEMMIEELRKYRVCGWVFLAMNLALSMMIFFMVYWNRTFNHHEITTIAMAAYTFVTLTVAIISVVRYRKYNSPVYSASKAISLASACVSMLTLESTMLTTFADETMDMTSRKILLGVSGGVISVFIIIMAVYMIMQGTKKIKQLSAEVI